MKKITMRLKKMRQGRTQEKARTDKQDTL